MRNNTVKLIRLLIGFGLIIGIASCNGSNKKDTSSVSAVDDEQVKKEQVVRDVKKVMVSLPSPVETTMLLKRAGAGYNEALLNPTANASKYYTDKQKALNLGVYGADLSYASIFEQDQTIMQYMNTSKKLAIGLDLLSAIDQSIIDRLEANHDNRDSVMRIISETFLNSNSTLKEDNRPEMAALILAGGWVEALYLATQLTTDVNKDKDLIERIVEQKLSFGELERLLAQYSSTNKDVKDVQTQLKAISDAFSKITISKSGIETIVDSVSKQTVLKSTQKISITQEQYDALKVASATLRNSIIQ